jgi:cobalt-zinc-cadmium efflux system protein
VVAQSHVHHHRPAGKALGVAFALTSVVLVVEAVAGYVSGSLALLSDAGHVLTDVAALGLAWFVTYFSERPASEQHTFGYHRSRILAALANATVLLVIAAVIAVEAVVRLQHPRAVQGGVVIAAAVLAIGANAYIAVALSPHRGENLNVRSALLHVVSDIGASLGVVVSGLLAVTVHSYAADPIVSLLIAALISYGAWEIIRDTVVILMEGAPRGLDLAQVRAAMLEVPGVEDVHDLHVWSLSDGYRLLSAHIMVPDQALADTATLLADVKRLLHQRFRIEHATIEPECIDCRVPPRRVIQLHEPRRSRDSV